MRTPKVSYSACAWKQSRVALFLAAMFAAPASARAGEKEQPWPAPVSGWKAPEAGEHPRLFFRRAELPALKKRAETPEGKAILTRLKVLLGGGESMPTVYNDSKKAYEGKLKEAPVGAYTLWHGSGFGLLYQLTGEKKYADLGRQCVEKAFAGQVDRDDRYGWASPGGALRAGPSIGAIAMAYDLCYDGWDADFRTKVALALQNYEPSSKDAAMSLRNMALNPKHHPASNHWGPQVGGAGLAVLAIKGDPGTDDKLLASYLAGIEKNTVRALTQGYGDHGFYAEYQGPAGINSDTAFVPFLQALKIAGGKDYISTRPNAPWITLVRVLEMVPRDGKPYYALRHPSSYGTELFSREGLSRGGQFAQGFGTMTDEQKPALLWAYNHFVEPDEKTRTFDTVSPYPHRAVLAFVNWPMDMKEKNPTDILPKVVADKIHGYYLFRNRWQDSNDILVTALLLNGPKPYKSYPSEPVMVWGLGMQMTLGSFKTSEPTHFDSSKDGSGVVSGGGSSLAVDFSAKSGAAAVIVLAGPGTAGVKAGEKKGPNGASARTTVLAAGGQNIVVLTLQTGAAPEVRADGNRILVGTQSFAFDGKNLGIGPPTP